MSLSMTNKEIFGVSVYSGKNYQQVIFFIFIRLQVASVNKCKVEVILVLEKRLNALK